jgi:UDP-2,4-diacetamido-2,4,6-trideoxy-beta-L-altropyranose hydrolase
MMAAADQIRVLIRCDAARRLGSGHAMRCLTLAQALAGRGTSVTFACSAESFETVPALGASGFPLISLDAPLDPAELVATGQQWDAAVVDHYRLDARYETVLRHAAPVILVIDDLADRPHDCDILVDQTVGRQPSDYAKLVGSGTESRLGADYALLRPEFVLARPASLAARSKGRRVSRIFLSLGMTDIDGITAWALKATLAANLDAEIAVAVGSSAESLPELRTLAAANPRVVLHLDSTEICALIATSDLAVGAGGTTSWERCCLGLPTVMLVLADNQAMIAQTLARLGAAELVQSGDADAIVSTLRRLAADASARISISKAAGAVTDGRGTDRAVDTLISRITRAS